MLGVAGQARLRLVRYFAIAPRDPCRQCRGSGRDGQAHRDPKVACGAGGAWATDV
jgi:hypothetical protein